MGKRLLNLIVWTIVVLFGVSLGRNLANNVMRANTPPVTPHLTTSQYVELGLVNCVKGGNAESLCRCALTKLANTYGVDGAIQMDKDYAKTGDIPEGIITVIKECQ